MDRNDLMKYWFSTTPEMVFIKDIEGKYLLVSNAYVKLAGLKQASEIEGKFDIEIYPTKLAQSFITQDKQVIKSGETVVDVDFIENDRTGNIVIETTKMPIYDESGEIIGVHGVAKNITEKYKLMENLKKNDEKIQHIIDVFPFPFWIKNNENRYIMINKAYSEFYNVNADKITDHNIGNILTVNKFFKEDDLEVIKGHDAYTLETGNSSKITVTANINGKSKKIEIIKMPLKMFKDSSNFLIAGISHLVEE